MGVTKKRVNVSLCGRRDRRKQRIRGRNSMSCERRFWRWKIIKIHTFGDRRDFGNCLGTFYSLDEKIWSNDCSMSHDYSWLVVSPLENQWILTSNSEIFFFQLREAVNFSQGSVFHWLPYFSLVIQRHVKAICSMRLWLFFPFCLTALVGVDCIFQRQTQQHSVMNWMCPLKIHILKS